MNSVAWGYRHGFFENRMDGMASSLPARGSLYPFLLGKRFGASEVWKWRWKAGRSTARAPSRRRAWQGSMRASPTAAYQIRRRRGLARECSSSARWTLGRRTFAVVIAVASRISWEGLFVQGLAACRAGFVVSWDRWRRFVWFLPPAPSGLPSVPSARTIKLAAGRSLMVRRDGELEHPETWSVGQCDSAAIM